MRKLQLTAVALFLCCCFLSAQKGRLGFTAGATVANYHFKVDNVSASEKSIVGFTVGLLTDVPLTSSISFQPAVNLTGKGTKQEEDVGGSTEKVTLHTYHAELLLNFLFSAPLKTTTFFVGGGPSASVGIFGKWKYVSASGTESDNVKYGNTDNDDLKALDFGLNVTTGLQFTNGVFIAVNYNHGLNNLAPGGSSDGKLKSSYFGFRLGFMLNTKK